MNTWPQWCLAILIGLCALIGIAASIENDKLKARLTNAASASLWLLVAWLLYMGDFWSTR